MYSNRLPECAKKTNWEAADRFCRRAGARLCTYAELRAGVSSNTGCSLDWKRTWTMTSCVPPTAAVAAAAPVAATAAGINSSNISSNISSHAAGVSRQVV